MSVVYRIFVVDFSKLAGAVVNLLIKSHRHLVGVNLLYVSSLSPLPALHINLVLQPTRMGWAAWSSSCSRNARPVTALVGPAQWEPL